MREKLQTLLTQQGVKGRIRKGHRKCIAFLPLQRDAWYGCERAGNRQHPCIVVQPDDLPSGTDLPSRETCDDSGATSHIQHAVTWLERCLLNKDGCPGGENRRNQAALIDFRSSSMQWLLLLLTHGVLLLVLNSKVRGLVHERIWRIALSLIAGHSYVAQGLNKFLVCSSYLHCSKSSWTSSEWLTAKIARICSGSGGPPAASSAPNSFTGRRPRAGQISTSIFAGPGPGFRNPWTTPRGMETKVPDVPRTRRSS